MISTPRYLSFALVVSEGIPNLGLTIGELFTDSWVESYQIGFGPPLIRSRPELRTLRKPLSALSKLELYIKWCLLDEDHCRGLAERHRQRLVKHQRASVEAEALDSASAQVWDISCCLYRPSDAPEAVLADMRAGRLEGGAGELFAEARTGRIYIHLHDPSGQLLLDKLRAEALLDKERVSKKVVAFELRVPVASRMLFTAWVERMNLKLRFGHIVYLGEPYSHARAYSRTEL